jgi:hypothetical protein
VPRTPLGLLDLNPAFAASAANVEAWQQNTYEQAVRDAASGLTWINVQDEGVLPANSSAANLTALNTVIDALSVGDVLYFPPAPVTPYMFNGPFNPITKKGVTVLGAGTGQTILAQDSTSLTGTFFQAGVNTTGPTERVKIRGLRFDCQNVPPAGHPVFYFENDMFFDIEDIFVNQIGDLIRVGGDGSDTRICQTGSIRNVYGNHRNTAGNMIWLRMAGSLLLDNIVIHAYPGADLGVPLLIEPQGSPTSVEPIRVTNCQLWSAPPGSPTNPGQFHNIKIDFTNGGAHNIWFENCEFDYASVAAVEIVSLGGSERIRYVKFDGCYLGGANTGRPVRINHNGTGPITSVKFIDCRMSVNEFRAVTQGTGPVHNLVFDDCDFVDINPGVNKSSMIALAHGNAKVVNCDFRGVDGGVTNCDSAVETVADVDNIVVADNTSNGLLQGFMKHFAYANFAGKRSVRGNLPNDAAPTIASAATLKIPPEAHMVQVTGTTTITAIQGPSDHPITLKFDSTKTNMVTASAAIKLAGGANFNSTPEDTLTLVTNSGAFWWETARSNNA